MSAARRYGRERFEETHDPQDFLRWFNAYVNETGREDHELHALCSHAHSVIAALQNEIAALCHTPEETAMPGSEQPAACDCGGTGWRHVRTTRGVSISRMPCSCRTDSAVRDQGIWTMTDAEFKAELHKEFKRGLRFEKFDYDRLGILAQAVGIARQQLRDGTPEKALATLDSAVNATLQLHREALISIGMDAEIVDSLLGLAR